MEVRIVVHAFEAQEVFNLFDLRVLAADQMVRGCMWGGFGSRHWKNLFPAFGKQQEKTDNELCWYPMRLRKQRKKPIRRRLGWMDLHSFIFKSNCIKVRDRIGQTWHLKTCWCSGQAVYYLSRSSLLKLIQINFVSSFLHEMNTWFGNMRSGKDSKPTISIIFSMGGGVDPSIRHPWLIFDNSINLLVLLIFTFHWFSWFWFNIYSFEW